MRCAAHRAVPAVERLPQSRRVPGPRDATTQRRAALLDAVRGSGASIRGLSEQFGVSSSTIRRDLAELADQGHVVRTYGGALDTAQGVERTLREKDASRAEGKDRIARAAASRIRDGETVLLDAGTTTARLARHLADRPDLTVVTNGLTVLLALAESPHVEVVVLGGRLRRPNEAILGRTAEQELRHLAPDRAFLGADGVTERGLNCPTLEQSHLKHAMLRCAGQAWVLADSGKIGAERFPCWAPVDRECLLLVDEEVGAERLPPGCSLWTSEQIRGIAAE